MREALLVLILATTPIVATAAGDQSGQARTLGGAQAAERQKSQELERAAAALAAGRRADAAAEFRAVAEKYGSVNALLQLARIQAGDGDAAGALATLERAQTLAPNAEEVLASIAQVSLRMRLVVPAILALDPLTRICPGVANYHYLLGVALMQAGDMILAVDSLQRADQLEPNKALTLIALGLALNNRKMHAEAAAHLARALEIEPDSLEAMAALSEAEEGLGQSDTAETHARRVLERASDNATANLVLGLVLMRQQRFADARDAFLRATAADPRSPKPDYQLSLAYARLGDNDTSDKYRVQYQQKLRDMEKSLEELRKRTGLPSEGGMK